MIDAGTAGRLEIRIAWDTLVQMRISESEAVIALGELIEHPRPGIHVEKDEQGGLIVATDGVPCVTSLGGQT